MAIDDATLRLLKDEEAPFMLFHGSANPELAAAVARELRMEIAPCAIDRFPDGEIHVQIGESVRGRDAYIIQSTCTTYDPVTGQRFSVNENMIELFIMLDTLRRANAARLTAIIPYFGYARQDRKAAGREPITAKLVANLLAASGASRVLAIDLHSPAIQGFFDIGMDHLTAMHALARHVRQTNLADAVVVSPDTGGVKRADTFANLVNLPLAILHKRRADATSVEIRSVIGDVVGKRPIIVDDIIATGSTLRRAADALLNAGAQPDMTIVASHPVLIGNALDQLDHPAIKHVVVADTIPVALEKRRRLAALEVVSLAPLLAEAIVRLHRGQSISALYRSERTDEPTLPWPL
jgi:ribose-phosphate pyrophosphokinase